MLQNTIQIGSLRLKNRLVMPPMATARMASISMESINDLVVSVPRLLILTTEGIEGEPLTVGVSKIFGRRKGRDVKIKRINHDVAAEIIDSLGAIIMTYKN